MIIKVKVKPGSGLEKIEKIEKIGIDEYRVSLKKPAVSGKANLELVKLLKKYFSKDIKLIKGRKSKNKIIELT